MAIKVKLKKKAKGLKPQGAQTHNEIHVHNHVNSGDSGNEADKALANLKNKGYKPFKGSFE